MKSLVARSLSGALRSASATSKLTSRHQIQFQPQRDLNLLEYQAKGLLQKYNVTVQDFRVAQTEAEAKQICSAFPCKECVIKAQVLAGGRGKGHFESGLQGGVKLAYSLVLNINKIPSFLRTFLLRL